MKEKFLFNFAYALFKLNDKNEKCLEIWDQEVTNLDPCIKMMASVNLAVAIYINELWERSTYPEIESIHRCVCNLDLAIQTL